ncbi:MAG: hypothetical protein EOM91_19550 [Sphingobacteriia bacterium]|nr:hypothetical protein [Sphingobacteriia bacterium]NCC40596.1 hypothetical protein [Gammaproteobacteria bacterium]
MESEAESPWNGWPNQRGIRGRIALERVAESAWNQRPNAREMGGRIGVEYAVGRLQPPAPRSEDANVRPLAPDRESGVSHDPSSKDAAPCQRVAPPEILIQVVVPAGRVEEIRANAARMVEDDDKQAPRSAKTKVDPVMGQRRDPENWVSTA